jgi:hypothetical protein
MDQAYALARLDALVAEHGLSTVRTHWQEHSADFLSLCPGTDPLTLHVHLAARADVTKWAAVLGVEPKTYQTIYEYEDQDGRWCAVWRETARLARWMPGIELSASHSEDRWIDRPAANR